MGAPELLVAGRALLWFAVPLILALRELWLVRPRQGPAARRSGALRPLR